MKSTSKVQLKSSSLGADPLMLGGAPLRPFLRSNSLEISMHVRTNTYTQAVLTRESAEVSHTGKSTQY